MKNLRLNRFFDNNKKRLNDFDTEFYSNTHDK